MTTRVRLAVPSLILATVMFLLVLPAAAQRGGQHGSRPAGRTHDAIRRERIRATSRRHQRRDPIHRSAKRSTCPPVT
ncbi:MAG: hypothetical protein ACM4AI_15665 [Acidobacteriota bacterium]